MKKIIFLGLVSLMSLLQVEANSAIVPITSSPSPIHVSECKERVPFWVLGAYGWDGSFVKILVENKSGHRFFVWYYDKIGAEIGERVIISIRDLGYSSEKWVEIESANGTTSTIHKWSQL